MSDYLSRRPHRSFRLTRRRDYARSLALPGYWAFTFEVGRTMSANKRLFLGLVAFYAGLSAVLVGISSQDIYSQLSGFIEQAGSEVFSGGFAGVGEASLLLITGLTGTFTPQLTEAQQVFSGLLFLLIWLSTVWLLRALHAGHTPSLRDALYNSGSPIVPTGIVLLLMMAQLIPAAVAIILMNAALSTQLFEVGVIAMIVSLIILLLIVATAYLVTSTAVALIVVTLPGMYPWKAIRAAGDLVVGRRIRLLLRLSWLALGSLLAWIAIILPSIVVDRWLKGALPAIEWFPLVPIIMAIVTAFTVVWSATYTFLLYRKVVDDDAAPA